MYICRSYNNLYYIISWNDLLYKGKNDELKERRKIATEQNEKKVKEQHELAKSKKKEFEKFVLDKSIKEEQEKRDELQKKKKENKFEAEKDLYKFIDNYDHKANENQKQTPTETMQEYTKDKKEDLIPPEPYKNISNQLNVEPIVMKKNLQHIEKVAVKQNKLNQIFLLKGKDLHHQKSFYFNYL